MKLCAIYNVWDDWDLLRQSVHHITPLVDEVIIVGSEISNYGEISLMPDDIEGQSIGYCYKYNPGSSLAMHAETDKRNYGLEVAKNLRCTHFLTMDADEFYHPEEFLREKQRFIDNPDLAGIVCSSQVFFKEPTLTIGKDITLVPFIHKITPEIKHCFNKKYPFAWDKFTIRIDPTRSLNIDSGVEWSDITMMHYSWVRKDYEKKIRNSTARSNLERSSILEDLANAKPGYFCTYYQKELYEVPNYFNIHL